MSRYRSTTLFVGACISACAATACAPHHTPAAADETAALAEDGTDASEVESQSSSLTASFVLGAGSTTDAGQAATTATAARAFFTAGCLRTRVDAAQKTAVHDLTDCGGPWGLVHVTGTVTLIYESVTTPDGRPALRVDVSGTGLKLNRSIADYNATAVIAADGLAREMHWTGHIAGTTARGRAYTRDADWTVRWTAGEPCIALDGTATGTVMNRTIQTTVSDYRRCKNDCPAAGGRIVVQNTRTSAEVSIDYDGGDSATFTEANGRTVHIALACGL